MAPFLRNHAPDIAAMDLLVVPTIGFDLLYALVIIRLLRTALSLDGTLPRGGWLLIVGIAD
jgi:hypothetical protein